MSGNISFDAGLNKEKDQDIDNINSKVEESSSQTQEILKEIKTPVRRKKKKLSVSKKNKASPFRSMIKRPFEIKDESEKGNQKESSDQNAVLYLEEFKNDDNLNVKYEYEYQQNLSPDNVSVNVDQVITIGSKTSHQNKSATMTIKEEMFEDDSDEEESKDDDDDED